MKKWIARTAVACATVLLLAVAAVQVMRWLNPEPRAQGRRLSEWVAQLTDSLPAKREEATAAVRSIGAEAVPYLARELRREPNFVQQAAKGAAQYAPGFLKAPLEKVSAYGSGVVEKHRALHAIGLLGTNGVAAVPIVGEMLRQPDVGLAAAAANTLVFLGTNSLPELITSLDDGSYDTRSYACQALRALGKDSAPAVPRLAQILAEERGAIAATAAMTLAAIRGAAVPALAGFLQDTNAMVRQQAALALANIGVEARPALPEVLKLAEDQDARVRWAAVNAAAAIDRTSKEAGAVLVGALEDPNEEVRLLAATATQVRPGLVRENREQFRRLLDDEAAGVRAAAAKAIGQTGQHGEWAIPRLSKMLEDPNAVVRDGARYALATITNSIALVAGGPLVPREMPKSETKPRIEVRDQ